MPPRAHHLPRPSPRLPGFAYGECFSSRKREAEQLQKKSDFGMQTGSVGTSSEKSRWCMGLF